MPKRSVRRPVKSSDGEEPIKAIGKRTASLKPPARPKSVNPEKTIKAPKTAKIDKPESKEREP